MSDYDVVVVGGGFAGLSAAVDLASRGARVAVLESRPRLGGRATSYRDRVTQESVDNGQHVLFGCYHETFRFLRRLGVEGDVRLQDSLAVTSVDHDGRFIHFRCPHLPPPLHLLGGIVEWDDLPWTDRVASVRLLGPLRDARRRAQASSLPELSETTAGRETVSEWLERHGQGVEVRRLLWEPLALAALNQSADVAVTGPFLRVLGALSGSGRQDSAVGLPGRPLEQFYAEPARRFIESRGGVVRINARARVTVADNRRMGVEANRRLFSAPTLIAAVPWHALAQLFDPAPPALTGIIKRAAAMTSSPIVTVHLWFHGPVLLDEPFIGLLGRTTHWIFDKRGIFGAAATHLTLVSSDAAAIVERSNAQLVEVALEDLRRAVPMARGVPLRHALVIRERHATFSLAAGEPERPNTRTVVRGLFLAGDWIETGLPGTIEGAVVSGYRAAAAAFQDLHA